MSALTRMFRRNQEKAPVDGGKLYKIINTCSIVGLFVAVGLVVLMIMGTINCTSSIVGIVAAIAILCFSCILALPWIRKIENNEFKVLSYVFLGIVAASCLLWIISDIVIISEYKAIRAASAKSDLTDEESAKLLSSILATINFLKASIFISIQFSVASFIATGITKYKKTMLPFQVIAYVSYLFCDFWFSGFLFSVNINSNIKKLQAEGLDDMINRIFSVNEKLLNFLTSKAMITIFVLAIAYVIIANAIIKRQEQRRIKNASEDIATGKVAVVGNDNIQEEQIVSETPEEKLEKLKTMFEKELITKEEYETKKNDILKDM